MLVELGENCLKHAIHVPINLFIDESNESITLSLEKLGASGVVAKLFVGGMRRAVDFDDEFFVPTDEISKIRPDRLLPDELEAAETAPAQRPPDLGFGGRLVFPQGARTARLNDSMPRMDSSFLPVPVLIVFRACDHDLVCVPR